MADDILAGMHATEREQRGKQDWLCLALVLLLASLFFLSFFNRFSGLRSGDGEFTGGVAFLHGVLPYRDYYTAGPPLNQIKAAIELHLFGQRLFVSRLCGVVERLVIATLLFWWLRRIFSRHAASLATVVTIIVSAGDRTDPIASYNHDAILFAMMCGYAACVSFDSRRERDALLWACAAGVGAGLSSLTKQTVGLGTTATVLCVATAATAVLVGKRRALCWALSFLLGCALPILGAAAYLSHLGVLRQAMTMLFVSGPKAKAAHPHDFLIRELKIGWDNWPFLLLGIIGLAMSARAVWRSVRQPQHYETALRKTLWVLAVALLLIALAELLALTPLPAIENFSKAAVYYTLLGTSVLLVATILAGLRRTGHSVRLWSIAIFASVSWAAAATLSLSWPAFEAMTLPGLALLVAAAVDGVGRGRYTLYALLGVTVFFQVREKLDEPFSFDQQRELPVRFQTKTSSLPQLRGMRLAPETVRLLDSATAAMKSAGQGQTVFTYPEMSLLYALSGKPFPTRAGSHNIDVVPDWFAHEEALRLLAAQPEVLLYAKPTEEQLRAEEQTWRDGQRSGQRDLMAAMDCLISHYRLKDTFLLAPGDNPIHLYVRDAPGEEEDAAKNNCTLDK